MRLISIFTVIFSLLIGSAFANEVNVYSARHYDSDIQLYDKFTAKTGIKVNVVSGKSGAIEKRIITNGSHFIKAPSRLTNPLSIIGFNI